MCSSECAFVWVLVYVSVCVFLYVLLYVLLCILMCAFTAFCVSLCVIVSLFSFNSCTSVCQWYVSVCLFVCLCLWTSECLHIKVIVHIYISHLTCMITWLFGDKGIAHNIYSTVLMYESWVLLCLVCLLKILWGDYLFCARGKDSHKWGNNIQWNPTM